MITTEPKFYRECSIEEHEYIIAVFDSSSTEFNEETFFFGYPINLHSSKQSSAKEYLNQLKGYWSKLEITESAISITQDIVGGNRLYYMTKDNTTVISDNYQFILNKIDAPIQLNNFEYSYWKKHRYTTGAETLIKGLHKFQPATITT